MSNILHRLEGFVFTIIRNIQFFLQGGGAGGVFEFKFCVGIDDAEGFAGHEGGLVEARKDEFQFARISVDIADGEDAFGGGFEFFGVDGDQVFMQVQAEIGDGTKFHGQAEEGKEGVAFDFLEGFVCAFDGDGLELPVTTTFIRNGGGGCCAFELFDLSDFKIDEAFFAQGLHFIHAIGVGAELVAAVNEGDGFGDGLEVQRPIQRAVAAADDDDVFTREFIHLAHGVEYGCTFEVFDAGDRGFFRHEGAAARGDDDDFGFEDFAGVGGEFPAVSRLFEGFGHFLEVELRGEGRDLFEQAGGQVVACDDRPSGDVVDGFFGVKLRALAARFIEDVDEGAFHIQQAKFEGAEKAAGACADYENICFVLGLGRHV